MSATIVIPTYWADGEQSLLAPGAYDHSTDVSDLAPELERCLASLEQVRELPQIVLLVVCAAGAAEHAAARVRAIAEAHPALDVLVVSNREASRIVERIDEIVPAGTGEAVSLRGYGAIRNMGLAVAAIMGRDAVVFLDDDEVVLGPDFMTKALYGLGHETRTQLPILAKSGYFFDRSGSPLADTSKAGLTHRWWSKRTDFNTWMKKALSGTRISRSNYVCGGCMALHARAYARVPFDPFITRGEDLDYLLNLRLVGLDMWFDNEWVVKHLPPESTQCAPRFMQDVYRWYYERAKLAHANRQNDLTAVTPESLMPYPGPWLSHELPDRVRRTAFARMILTGEHVGYWHIWQHGRADAERYASEHCGSYLRFMSFWPTIVDGLWCDASLRGILEGR